MSTSLTALCPRPYRGAADLRRIQDAMSARFGRGTYHAGEIAWSMRDYAHVELGPLVTLVESAGGELLGWTWFHPSGWFDAVPAFDPDRALAEALVEAAMAAADRCRAAGDDLSRLSVLCDDADIELVASLAARGFAPIDAGIEVTRRSLDGLAEPTLPDGLHLAAVEDEAMAVARVECHRAAFAPSTLTLRGFLRVRRTWPYRPELDRVVVDSQGTVLASCLAWIDEATGWGVLEPVGTRPEHRRRGLARAACLDALRALRAAGAHGAQVSCDSGSAGCATYHSLGFRTERHLTIHRRTVD